jgi:hypothetical protein
MDVRHSDILYCILSSFLYLSCPEVRSTISIPAVIRNGGFIPTKHMDSRATDFVFVVHVVTLGWIITLCPYVYMYAMPGGDEIYDLINQ